MSIKKIPLSKVHITPEEELEIVNKYEEKKLNKIKEETLLGYAERFVKETILFSFEDKKKILENVKKLYNKDIDDCVEEASEDMKHIGSFIESKLKEKF